MILVFSEEDLSKKKFFCGLPRRMEECQIKLKLFLKKKVKGAFDR